MSNPPTGTIGFPLYGPEQQPRRYGTINPTLAQKSVSLQRPTEPEFVIPNDDALFDKVKYDAYKARKDVYKIKLAKYERQEKAFDVFIQDTIAATTSP